MCLLFIEQTGISCRVAEGRALGRHGNRIGIIYPDRRCQLSPGNGDHEIRVRENLIRIFPSLFSHSGKGVLCNWGIFSPARPAVTEGSSMMGTSTYELRCRECGKTWGNQPRRSAKIVSRRSKSPTITIPSVRAFRAKCSPRARPTCGAIASCCRCQRGISPPSQLVIPRWSARRVSAEKIGSRRLLVKNDAVCLPTLSFKDRVVAVALANARSFRVRYRRLFLHRESREFGRRASRPRRLQGVDLYSLRSRAGKNSRHAGFRRGVGAHQRQLRSRESPVLADRRRTSLGIRERQPCVPITPKDRKPSAMKSPSSWDGACPIT